MKNKLLWQLLSMSRYAFYGLIVQCFLVSVLIADDLVAQSKSIEDIQVNIRFENSTLKEAFSLIEQKTGFHFAYSGPSLKRDYHINWDASTSLGDVLRHISKNTNLQFRRINETIHVIPREKSAKPVVEEVSSEGEQSIAVSGKVISGEDQESLPGVNVVIKGSSKGTVTDINGEYRIDVPDASTVLVFSSVGYVSDEVTVGDKAEINITLMPDIKSLSEVVVVAYGTQKKRDVIGSISSIKADVLEPASGSSNFANLLQGQAAGASVQTSSGRLGASVDVKIRGLSSISASTSPLWIIDGVPIITNVNTAPQYTAEQSPMSLINQADIESIEILKDAAATSIYGSRGSNGVILITTKSGTAGKTSINLDYSTGISDLPFQRVEFVNTTQWFQMKDAMKEAYGLGKYDMSDYYAGSAYVTEQLTRDQAESIDTDWRDEAMQRGSFQNINFSTIGGGDKARFFLSANYRKDKGVMLNDDLERYGARANIDIDAARNFKTGAKINLSLSNSNRGKNFDRPDDGNKSGRAGGFSYINSQSAPINPVYSLANPNEYYNPYMGNPVALSDPDNLIQDFEMYRALANIYGEYTFPFFEELSARTELSVDLVQANRNTWLSKDIRWDGSLGQDVARTSRTFNYNFFLTYNKKIGLHSMNIVGGAEAQRSSSWYRSMEGQGLVGSYKELGTPSQLVSMQSGLVSESYLLAYFGRANYKFKDKYLVGISIRRDGSSVFTPDFRWGNFMAFSAGWIISDEPFMSRLGRNTFLKLRGSYGQTGNANIPSGLDATKYTDGLVYGSMDILATNGTLISSIGVSNLTWETTKNFDFGIDFGFVNDRINGSLAYYNKYVKDLLLASDLPYSSGISSIYGNIGDLVNSGVEFNVVSTNLESQSFNWKTSFNISFNHNEVKRLTPQVDQSGTGMVSNPYITKVGYAVRDYYMADFAGIDVQTGLPMIYALDQDYYNETGETRRLKDEDGNDVLIIDNSANATSNRFHLIGKNQIPVYYGGITNRFTYKAFDFGFLITFSGGNYIYDTFMRNNATNLSYAGEILKDVYDNYWKEPGDVAKYQRLNWKGNLKLDDGTVIGLGDPRHDTDQFLFKGDYVKLKSVTIGYTLPKSSHGKKLLQGLRVYGTVENLYTLTEYPGWDPEGQGTIPQWDLPQLFSATLGLSVKF